MFALQTVILCYLEYIWYLYYYVQVNCVFEKRPGTFQPAFKYLIYYKLIMRQFR